MFKVGDKVVCVDRGPNKGIENGKVYVVRRVEDRHYVRLEGCDSAYYPSRFKLYEAAIPVPVKKFDGVYNVGDVVEIVKVNNWAPGRPEITVGMLLTVSAVFEQTVNVKEIHENYRVNKTRIKHHVPKADAKAPKQPAKAIIPFAEGVEVACIDARNLELLRLKGRYVIEKVYANGKLKLKDHNGIYNPGRFTAVKAAAKAVFNHTEWVPKVGEKVYVKGPDKICHVNGMDCYVNDGREYTIVDIIPNRQLDDRFTQFYCRLDNNYSWSFDALVPVEFKPEAVKATPKAPAQKVEVGDLVYIVSRTGDYTQAYISSHLVNNGKKYLVQDVYLDRAKVEVSDDSSHWANYFDLRIACKAKDVPPLVHEKDLREELYEKQKGKGGICSFAFEGVKGKRRFEAGAPCHYQLQSPGRYLMQDIAKIAYGIRMEHNRVASAKNKENHIAFVNYIINESPWADCFLTKDINEAMTKDLYMDPQQHRNAIAGACVAMRSGSEHQKRLPLFKLLLDKGYSGAVAIILSANMISEGGKFVFTGFSGGHDWMDGNYPFYALINFFAKGYKLPEDQPYAKNNGGYSMSTPMTASWPTKDKTGIRDWFVKNVKAEVKGEGWAKTTTITEAAMLECADKIEQLLKDAK